MPLPPLVSHDITILHVWRFYVCWRLTARGYSELSAAISFSETYGAELSLNLVKLVVAVGFDFEPPGR